MDQPPQPARATWASGRTSSSAPGRPAPPRMQQNLNGDPHTPARRGRLGRGAQRARPHGRPAVDRKTRALQQQLCAGVKGDPALAHLPVLGPRARSTRLVERSSGDLSAYLDRGNMHPYPGGGPPLHNLDDLRPAGRRGAGQQAARGHRSRLPLRPGHHRRHSRPRSGRAAIYIAAAGAGGLPRRPRAHLLLPAGRPLVDRPAAGHAARREPLRPAAHGPVAASRLPRAAQPAARGRRRLGAGRRRRAGCASASRAPPPDVRQLLLRSADGTYSLVLWRERERLGPRRRRWTCPRRPTALDVVLGEPIALAQRFDPVASDAEPQRWADPSRIPVDGGRRSGGAAADAARRGTGGAQAAARPAARAASCAAHARRAPRPRRKRAALQGAAPSAAPGARRPSASARRKRRKHGRRAKAVAGRAPASAAPSRAQPRRSSRRSRAAASWKRAREKRCAWARIVVRVEAGQVLAQRARQRRRVAVRHEQPGPARPAPSRARRRRRPRPPAARRPAPRPRRCRTPRRWAPPAPRPRRRGARAARRPPGPGTRRRAP